MIAQRGSKFTVTVYDPRKKGKRWVGTFVTKAEAKRAEREAEAGKHQRRLESETCERFADRWLEEFPRAAAATRRTYEYALANFKEDFRGRKLSDLSRVEARTWALRQPHSTLRVVRAMYTDAINIELCEANPFSNLRIAKPKTEPRELDRLTAAEVDRLAGIALDHHEWFGPTFAAMILVSAYTGIRPGELFALRPQDVTTDELLVNGSVDGTGQLKAPKNDKARTVVLPTIAADAINVIDGWQRQPHVFQTKRGRRFSKPALHSYWNPVRAVFGQPTLRFYTLRHTCATLLLEAGLQPWEVAVQLGHTDGGKLVMSTYGHPSEDLARDRIRMAFGSVATPERPSELGQSRAGLADGRP